MVAWDYDALQIILGGKCIYLHSAMLHAIQLYTNVFLYQGHNWNLSNIVVPFTNLV